MVQMKIIYEGQLHCNLTHGPSGKEISTDAPKDNHGKGESFSPTDLVASALGACMMTVMGIFAERHGIKLEATQIEVIKEMIQEPVRRIGKISVSISFCPGIPAAQRAALERVAHSCPVHKSLHPDIEVPVKFIYPD